MIKVIYNKTCGRCVQSEPLTSGMVGQPIEFEYSPDFDGLTLTAVFTNGKTTVDVLNPGNQCVIPHEVLDTVGTLVKVGIYATKGNELVIPTVYAAVGIVLKGADPSGDVSVDPTLPVWAQIQALMGDLNDLNTEAKNNLVAAINEATQTGSGGASIAMRVDGGYIQYSTDKGKTWVNLIAEADLKGEPGTPGTPGKDGHSPVVTATKSGKTTTICVDGTAIATVEDGTDGAPGVAGIPGKDGTDGHTPVKGTDYWTASDKAEVVAEAAAAVDLTPYAKKNEVPTKTSQLTNDSGFLTSHQDISGKQDKATLEADVSAAGFTKNTGTYSKPAGGIPKSDLAAAVQTSLGKADTALQEHQSLAAYRTAAAQDVIDSGKVDKVTGKGLSSNDYTNAAKAKVDALAPVATSGSYNDLTDKPTPLTGTTSILTPTQVYDAVSAGVPVKVQYKDDTYGLLSFTAFNIAESFTLIVSQTIVYVNGGYILAELIGNKSKGIWSAMFAVLAEKADIPVVPTALKNPNALTIKLGSTTVTYDGSAAKTVTIADGTEVSY